MNKDLISLRKIIKFFAEGFIPHSIEMLFIALFLFYFSMDNGYEKLRQATSTFIVVGLLWYLCLFLLLVVYFIVKKRSDKKSNIEKLIDEEIKK